MTTLTEKYRTYPSYKPADVEWLGEIPEHWEVRRIKRVADLNPSKAEAYAYLSTDTPVTFLPMERVGAEGQVDVREKMATSRVWNGFTYFRRNDVIVAKITPCFENGKGALLDSLPTEIGFGSTEFHVLRAKLPVNPQFLFRLTTETTFRQNGTEAMTGAAGQKRVPAGFVANYKVPLPPLAEQRAIAAFLDRETGKIDAFISKKERLIQLLQEKRTALISRAVTKGLDANAPIKESGVEWLGEIPAHWEVKRLRYLIEGNLTYGANAAAEYVVPNWPRYLRITDFASDGTLREDTFRSLPPEIASDHLVESGDLLLARSGATVGKAFLVNPEIGQACHAGYLIRARPRRDLIAPRFLHAFAQSQGFACWKDSTFIIATIQNISAEKYANLPVPTPPLAEQREIAAYLDREVAKLDSLTTKVNQAIELLRELRTTLISAAVTGRIDVREETECT